MTNAIIKLILTYAEYLRRVEAYHLSRAAHETNTAKVAYIHHRVDAIVAERQALDAMVRVYIARTHMQPRTRKAA